MLNSHLFSKRIIALVAPNFEEGFTVYCLDQMREARLPSTLISLSKGLVRGLHGIWVQPDGTLNTVDPRDVGMVIIPGSRSCASQLLSDPRVHRLLDNTIANGGYVVTRESAQDLVTTLGVKKVAERQHLLVQGSLSTSEFVQKLINIWRDPLLSPNGHLRSVSLV